ncbi:hypothetical protein [Pontibacter burrus]|uniref:DUF2244 domain-containing protein n=1 Tax=Pontibacter burrus TaxID=2704466 RepID=A0A6B3LTL4_9BACT|nr:hypothetical protein [Pontibacter burrus]NEM96830.1 hypothetical protein [Pontibacter burrus]
MEQNPTKVVYRINELGQAFYNKTLKEARKSVYLIGPVLLLLFAIVAWLLSGWSIYVAYLLAIPAGIVLLMAFFTPIVRKGRFINNLVSTLRINADAIEVETFSWFIYGGKRIQTKDFSLMLNEHDGGATSPANCRIIIHGTGKNQHADLVKAFFDDWESAVNQLKPLSKQA